ncbi:twin-arginine translocase TatA/TatE family subunit [Nocardioides sp. YIM B13467]|uniref:Sec-independent protein translocase subunit TatA/TatB n=1 Tax=Nocardioides sp. YIM B13467 TaxID=3366294 RepID=UPI00366D4C56
MLQNLTGWHALVILAIILLVFGSAKLPALARSVGQSVRILKDETHDGTAATTATAEPRPVTVEAVADRSAS